MSSVFRFFFEASAGPGGIFFIRLAVGLIFLTQGILKFSDPNMGVVRFTSIGSLILLSRPILSAPLKLFAAFWCSSGCGREPPPCLF